MRHYSQGATWWLRHKRAFRALALSIALAGTPPVEASVSPATAQLTARADSNLRAGELRPTDERALAFYRKAAGFAAEALEDDTTSARAHFILFAARGRLLVAQGAVRNLLALKKLRKHLDRSLQLDPNYSDALAAKGAMLMELPDALGGNKVEGEQLLRRAVVEYPVGPGTRLLLAKALIAKGDLPAARKELGLASYYACRQWRYRALRDAEALLREVDGEFAASGGKAS